MFLTSSAVASFNGCEINDNQAEDVCACLLKLPRTFFQRPAGMSTNPFLLDCAQGSEVVLAL